MAAHANLPNECIDALLAARVYHHDPFNAQDLDNIYTIEAMQCLVGYALRPSFSNPAFAVAIKLAKEKIAQLEFSVNDQLDIAIKSNVDFDVGMAPKTICCKELQDLINRLQVEARVKNKPKVPKKTSHGDKGKGKKLIGSISSDISPISEEEELEIAPLLVKRKRTSSVSRAKSFLLLRSPLLLQ